MRLYQSDQRNQLLFLNSLPTTISLLGNNELVSILSVCLQVDLMEVTDEVVAEVDLVE